MIKTSQTKKRVLLEPEEVEAFLRKNKILPPEIKEYTLEFHNIMKDNVIRPGICVSWKESTKENEQISFSD